MEALPELFQPCRCAKGHWVARVLPQSLGQHLLGQDFCSSSTKNILKFVFFFLFSPKFPFYLNKNMVIYPHKDLGPYIISLALAECWEKISDLSGTVLIMLVFVRRNSSESYFHFCYGLAGV